MHSLAAKTEIGPKSLLKLPILVRPLLSERPSRLSSLPERSPALNLPLYQHVPKPIAKDVSFRFQ